MPGRQSIVGIQINPPSSMSDLVRKLFKPAVLNASAYHVPASAGLTKLDAMENPYTWPDDFKQAWLNSLQQAELNRYPDAGCHDMKQAIADMFDVPTSAELMFGNGSDELIQIILMALGSESNVVLAPEPTFVMYRYLSNLLELDFVGVPLLPDFSLDMPAMLTQINEHQPAVIFLAWPNNPTGYAYAEQDLLDIIDASTGLVVIDEAYHAFAGRSMLSHAGRYPNLLVMRTLSKLGLAGLRLGTMAGPETVITELEKIRLPYNIGTLNQLSVNFISQHMDVLYEQAEKIKSDRQALFDQLTSIPSVQVWPSEANFILFRLLERTADEVHAELLKQNILIKNLSAQHELLNNCLRVTVGTRQENGVFIEALHTILN